VQWISAFRHRHGAASVGKCGLAGGQRGYFTSTIKACATTMSVTVIAGPLDYVGLEVRDVGIHP
jgi:hypothetical protein